MIHSYFLLAVITIVSLLGGAFGGGTSGTWQAAVPALPVTFITSPAARLPAQVPAEKRVTFAQLGYSRDETIQGSQATRTYTVNWPESWIPSPGSQVTIEFSHSKALKSYSTMAIDWNGIRVGSVLLTSSNADRGSYTAEIPVTAIQPGYNGLELVFYMGINDDICEDPDNPATWVSIKNISSLSLSYEASPPDPDLAIYPLPILEKGNLAQNSVTFILPDQPTPMELNALAVTSAKLGQLSLWSLANNVVVESSLKNQSVSGDAIYIGRSDHLAALKSGKIPIYDGHTFKNLEGQGLPEEAGIIFEQLSPSDPLAVQIFITGSSDESVLLAARAMGSEAVFTRLQGQLGVVLSVPEPRPTPETDMQRTITFESLGYEDQTASGTMNQTINYTFPLPKEWRVLTEANVSLHFAHSELVHPEHSSLTLSVNGTPVGSILLNPENAQNGQADFIVPARMFTIGNNRLTVTTNIKLVDGYVDEELCDEDYRTEAWVVVYADSWIKLPSGATYQKLDLADYPYGFVGSSNLSDVAFVVPDQPSPTDALAVGQVAFRLGQYADGLSVFPKVVGAANADEIQTLAPYQFLIGLPTQNPAIAELNDQLPLPFQAGTNNPQTDEEVAAVINPNGSLGVVEAVFSTDGYPRLIITGNNTEGLTWASTAVSDSVIMNDLKGDLVLADAPGRITAFSVAEPSQTVPEETITPEEQAAPVKTTSTWVLWVAGGVVIFSLLILVIFISVEIANRRKVR